ncbi:MAG TPA: hypothetical protein VES65_11470 [Solirubrobacteraceae bacterium]|nr:hypothetical protein [Solirubrobacteraceae bacterium]
MGFLKTPTGYQARALSVGTSDKPTLPTGANLSFDLSPLPCDDGNLAYYLPGFFVTFKGAVTQSGGTGNAIPQEVLFSILLDSIALNNAIHGTPLSPNFVKGWGMNTISYVGGGYNYATPNRGAIPAGNGTYNFAFSKFIPLCAGNGERPHHTAQLQCLFRKAQLVLQFNTVATVLSNFSPGASLGTTTVQVSALQLPEREIRVGPGVEWVDYQTPASSGQTEVKLQSFGNNTQLNNTEQGAGVCFAMAMALSYQQPGSFVPDNLQQLQIPFRGQIQTTHVEPIVLHQLLASMGVRRQIASDVAFATAPTTPNDIQDWPYGATNNPQSLTTAAPELNGALGLVLVPQGMNFEYSKVQVVNGDTSYYLTLSSGPSGTHHTLVQHLRSWTPQMWADAEKEIVDSKVKSHLFGSSTLKWVPKLLYGKSAADVDPKKLRFIPMTMKPVRAGGRFAAKIG